uniref:Protein MCM10 homolog n=1 Tax=Eptatretus burgeri TaxID=7764 RepID=A0A8C4PXH2_EPTBU
MERKMQGRRFIRLSMLPDKRARENLEEVDWVTIGIVFRKSTSQSASNGNTFSIWSVTDLRNMSTQVSFFLFGDVHKQLWKTEVRTVFGLLNPSLMKPKPGSDEVCVTVDNPQKVLLMGEAMDVGTCRANKKNGQPCSQLVNLSDGEFCIFHMQAQYRKLCSKRAELQAGPGSRPPRGHRHGKHSTQPGGLRQRLCDDGFHYGGVSSPACTPSFREPESRPRQSKKLTMGLIAVGGAQALITETREKLGITASQDVTGCSDDFKELVAAPTIGALNLKRHLLMTSSQDQSATKIRERGGRASKVCGISGALVSTDQEISAEELLRKYKQGVQETRRHKAEERQRRWDDINYYRFLVPSDCYSFI